MTGRWLTPRTLAEATGVSTDTLRHYERRGLLGAVSRNASGYRQYPPATVDRVLLIQRALIVGFSLAELREVLSERDRGGAPCRRVRGLLQTKLQALTERIAQLQALRKEFDTLLTDWDSRLARDGTRPLHLLETLKQSAPVEQARARKRERPAR